MNGLTIGFRSEVERIKRVSDMLCSAHSGLRDRYARRARFLDIGILAFSTWLTALAFVQPGVRASLFPLRLDPQISSGILAVCTFFLSLVQFKVDWKRVSEAHRRASHDYADVHREAGYLLGRPDAVDDSEGRRLLERYDFVSATAVQIPEKEFLRQKRRHLNKVAISRYLDLYPFASVGFTRIKFWVRDNCMRGGNGANQA